RAVHERANHGLEGDGISGDITRDAGLRDCLVTRDHEVTLPDVLNGYQPARREHGSACDKALVKLWVRANAADARRDAAVTESTRAGSTNAGSDWHRAARRAAG